MASRDLLSHALMDLSGQDIREHSLHLSEIIGRGAYGVVYKAENLHVNAPGPKFFAVKCQSRLHKWSRRREYQRREASLHKLVSCHPGIVKFYSTFKESRYVFTVLEYCPEGDLFTMLTESDVFEDITLMRSAYIQILDAVEFIHSRHVYHRDLKLDNILCKDKASRLLLTDFGLATGEDESSDFGLGSSYYMSPECIEGRGRLDKFSHAQNDIWALGVILVNFISTRNPWELASLKDRGFYTFIYDANFLRRTLHLSKPFNDLLRRVFALDPTERISIPQLRDGVAHVQVFTEDAKVVKSSVPAPARSGSQRQRVAFITPPLRRDARSSQIGPLAEDSSSSEGTVVRKHDSEDCDAAGVPRPGFTRPISNIGPISEDEEDDEEEPEEMGIHHARHSGSSSSLESAASSAGPVTPEMVPADANDAIAADADDIEEIDIGSSWPSPQHEPATAASKPRTAHVKEREPKEGAKKPLVKRKFFRGAFKKFKDLRGPQTAVGTAQK